MLASEHVFNPSMCLPFLWAKYLTKHLYVQSIKNLISTVT
jgi:hypothetical protein